MKAKDEGREKNCICGSSLVFKDGKVLFLWHEKLRVWLYPGGHREENEIPEQTATRETLEETGMRIKIINPDSCEQMGKSGEAEERPRPFKILYEKVPYKTGMHRHFDMVYLAKLLSSKEEANFGKGEAKRMKWISESEIGALKTFANVKWVARQAFSVIGK
jgi:8-oxo-dGTP diphosphatase